MTPTDFRAKWTHHELKERSAAQEHFIDLCNMLAHPTPAEADTTGDRFCFEKGAEKAEGVQGFADVWKRGHFGWEYKGPHANLEVAYRQLLQYREAIDPRGETFRVLKQNEEKQFGEYRTRRLVLEAWERLEGSTI